MLLYAQFEEDPDAFGMKLPQNPPGQEMQRSASTLSLASTTSMASEGAFTEGASELDSPRSSAAGSDWPETSTKPHRRFRPVRQVTGRLCCLSCVCVCVCVCVCLRDQACLVPVGHGCPAAAGLCLPRQ